MKKQIAAITLAFSMTFSLAACGTGKEAVSVQRADQLAISSLAQERYAGMVVSENIEKIQKDSSKTVLDTYVTVGQKVAAGDKLFTYDSEALQIDLEKLQLEVDKMTNERSTYEEQVGDLEEELEYTWSDSEIVRLTLEINTLKTKLLEIDYQLKAKNKEITGIQEMLEHTDILSPVDGTVRKIDEQGESGAYITIQQNGAFQVKGQLNEMNMANGLMMGSRVKILSRTNQDQFWMGTVTRIDMEGGTQNGGMDGMIGGMGNMGGGMGNTTSYPFYVELDDTTGLLLGQHVYMEVAQEDNVEMGGLWLPEYYLTELKANQETGEQTGNVLVADGSGKLVQKTVTLGMLDSMTGCYEILSGLNPEEYVADPTVSGSQVGAAVTYRNENDFAGAAVATEPAETEPELLPEETEQVTEQAETAAEETAGDTAEATTQEPEA